MEAGRKLLDELCHVKGIGKRQIKGMPPADVAKLLAEFKPTLKVDIPMLEAALQSYGK